MMRRRSLIRFAGVILPLMALAPPSRAAGQQSIPRVGVLWSSAPPSKFDQAFRKGMADLGYIDGKNILFEYRWSDFKPERLPTLAAELVQSQVDVIVSASEAAIRALQQATKTIPIVFAATGDPIFSRFVASLAHPGGNITGFSLMAPELASKRLQLLGSLVATKDRIAMLWDANNQSMEQRVKQAEAAAPSLNIKLLRPEIRSEADLEATFAALAREPPDALLVFIDPFTYGHRAQIVEFAAQQRLPAIYEDRVFVETGGLLSYGPDSAENFRRAAGYVDKILKGAKPSDLPVEQPTKFELVINMKAATALGLQVPRELLVRADNVIE